VGRLGVLLLIAASVGCWNNRDGVRADWGGSRGGLFDRGNAHARSKDRATNDSLDPADDVFLGSKRSQLADSGGKRKSDPIRGDSPRNPRAVDDDDSVLTEASSKESARSRGKSSDDDPSDPPSKPTGRAPIQQTAEYKKIRGRLEAIKATWSSEKLSGGQGFTVRCEVPHPTDPELAQVFEAKSSDELSALKATVVQAEKWRASVRRRFDPDEAKADPFEQ
jgi:hypothetical protein